MRLQKSAAQEGSIIVSILMVTIFIGILIYSLIVLANANLTRARGRVLLLQAQYAAESGADAAIATLNSGNDAYTGQATELTLLDNPRYKATFSSTVSAGSNSKEKIITATGKLYAPKTATTPSYTRTIQVTAQRSSSSTTSSIVSRNSLEIASSTKELNAKDIFVNGYINMNKNVNTIIAENITVTDKKTGAGNCSIGGSGSLQKPATFTTPGQTKTKLTLGYNNCINPPGNTSNANFDVLVNQGNIGKIQSTYIPWSEFMDTSYQNSPGGCTDWTSGGSTRDIPSTGNTKKTHYPDSGTGVASTCGTSGDINLGDYTYNIRDHVHVRANFCANFSCKPTFNNPDSGAAGIKFVFVEGTVNFAALYTAPGSGPIVFVVSGSDPASKTSACPTGGAAYIGSSNSNSSAPAAYFVVTNGFCVDKTKFGVNPGLGGISAKNIYLSSNPGNPFDLNLDPNFPTSAIPVDLAWKAVRYKRI